ncbi:MAG: DUF1178 family protein [Acidocella sp.]|nr:DUF1178 family protein [Acidocella sp.]
MIHYQLRCAAGHEFDGWFASCAGFEHQAEKRLVLCPVCADTDITRALMAPSIRPKARPAAASPAAPALPVPGPKPTAGALLPDHLRIALRQIREEVEKRCDYVGPDFANEARRIHYGEAEARGIYGEGSESEIESLADEGIEVSHIPWVKLSDG